MEPPDWSAPPLPWEIWERVASFCDARTLARFAQTSTGCRDVARRLNARARFVTAYSTLDDINAAISDVLRRTLDRPFMPDACFVLHNHGTVTTPEMSRLFRERLPARVQLIGAESPALIGTNGASNDTREVADSDDVSFLAVALVRIPHGSVTTFCGPPPAIVGPPPQAIFMLTAVQRSLLPVNAALSALSNEAVKVGGILASNKGFFVNDEHKRVGLAALTLQGRGLAVRYAVVAGREDVETALRKAIPPGRRYLGCFLVSCIARGTQMHRRPNHETTIFHRLYPNVPVIGFFSAGELGPPPVPDASGQHALHQYGVTSIFTVLEC